MSAVTPEVARGLLARIASLRDGVYALMGHIRELETALPRSGGVLASLRGELVTARELLEQAADGYLRTCPPEIYKPPESEDGGGSTCSLTTLRRIADGRPSVPPQRPKLRLVSGRLTR